MPRIIRTEESDHSTEDEECIKMSPTSIDSISTSPSCLCYGDNVTFLIQGQVLTITHKFNLAYHQMAILAGLTVASGGLFGIAALFVWQKGLLRHKYAALSSDAIYTSTPVTCEKNELNASTFRIFEVDLATHAIRYSSVGQPVQYDTPILIVHEASNRIMTFGYKKNVRLHKLLIHPHYRKLVSNQLLWCDKTQTDQSNEMKRNQRNTDKHRRPQSLAMNYVQRLNVSPTNKKKYKRSQSERLFHMKMPSEQASEANIELKQRKAWIQSLKLPNIYIPKDSQSVHYTCTIQRVGNQSVSSNDTVKWEEPMTFYTADSKMPIGIQSREHYKDSQRYLSTHGGQATVLPVKNDGQEYQRTWCAKIRANILSENHPRKVTLKVATYNVWMLPRTISAFTSASPKKKTRAKLIVESLPHEDIDILVLTECFDHRARKVLLAKLHEEGYVYSTPVIGHKHLHLRNHMAPSKWKLINGGVVVVSKYPILKVSGQLFEQYAAGSDQYADKGLLYVQILKQSLIVHLFASHLQAWNDPQSKRIRRHQMQMIKEIMQQNEEIHESDAVIYAGDFNVNVWDTTKNVKDCLSREYHSMLSILDAKDPSVLVTNTKVNDEIIRAKQAVKYSFDPDINPLAANGISTDGSCELLDVILISKNHRMPESAQSWVYPLVSMTSPWKQKKIYLNNYYETQVKLVDQWNLSDHFPVLSQMVFNMT